MPWVPKTLYSQNFEDLYLWRIFRHKDTGFFIDVGAYDPVTDSVTKAFYDHGWNGINIEPVPLFFRKFIEERPRDINLPIAIGEEAGKALINVYGTAGLASLDNSSRSVVPKEFQADYSQIEVSVSSLYEVIKSHAPREIDFLKIDVEGLEAQVIRSLSLEKLSERMWPNVVLLEATMPMSRLSSPSREESKSLLENWGYCRFFFDGLNDYYCRSADFDLYRSLSLPPNVFDEILFTPGAFGNLIDENRTLRQQLNDLSRQLDEKSTEILDLQRTLHDLLIDTILKREQIRDLRSEVLRTTAKLNWYRRQAKSLLGLLKFSNSSVERLNIAVASLLRNP